MKKRTQSSDLDQCTCCFGHLIQIQWLNNTCFIQLLLTSEEKMHMKELVFSLILLLQACGPLLAQTPEPEQPDSTGLLQRLGDRARETKDKVQVFGGALVDFFGAYYEDHIQPVAESYTEWASTFKSSMLEKIQTTIDNYWPSKATSSSD